MKVHSQLRWLVALAVLSFASAAVASEEGDIAHSLSKVAGELAAARASHDVVKTLALSDVQSQLNAVAKTLQAQNAIINSPSSTPAQKAQARALKHVLAQRAQQLTTEADQANGNLATAEAEGTAVALTTSNSLVADPVPDAFPTIFPGNIPSVAGPGGVSGFPPPGVTPLPTAGALPPSCASPDQ